MYQPPGPWKAWEYSFTNGRSSPLGAGRKADNGITITALINIQFPQTLIAGTVGIHFFDFLDQFGSQGAQFRLLLKISKRHSDYLGLVRFCRIDFDIIARLPSGVNIVLERLDSFFHGREQCVHVRILVGIPSEQQIFLRFSFISTAAGSSERDNRVYIILCFSKKISHHINMF